MQTNFVRWGAIAAFLGVALGAFGAHALRDRVTPDMLAVWQTGVQYHIAHALGLLLVGIFADRFTEGRSGRLIRITGTLFLFGILFFSGSLYALALTGVRVLGAITPLGGICFLTGWALLSVAAGSPRPETPR